MEHFTRETINYPFYLQPEVAKASGIPSKTIDNLIDRSSFLPFEASPGRGQRRRFTPADVARLVVLDGLAMFLEHKDAQFGVIAMETWLIEAKPFLPNDFLIAEPKSNVLAYSSPIRAEFESERFQFWKVSGDPNTLTFSTHIHGATLVYPFGRAVQRVWEELAKPYTLKRIDSPADWNRARFVDPNGEPA